MPICGFSDNIPVSPDGSGGVTAPDVTIPDVGSGEVVCITWCPDNVTLNSIIGLPSNVRLSGPDALGQIHGTYFAPDTSVTFDYIINATVETRRVWHDPKIHNTTPTRRRSTRKPAPTKAAKPAKSTKARGRK